ncbi:DUF2076 family protein [Mesorhizobium sp.]|uniref:DUF2076 domain-containing protein n=1 Tax=Mesorhizobium sp. TaxID=1871066 RepID=UPI000FE70AE5|nr:DUF2076 family protein [Mesorhizobium sp.]RWP63106.1 MAG: DUF2076 family protein [Mesorhizobium sp.]
MDRNDQQAIANLFEKLANVERQTPPRDAEAECFIYDQIARQPGAPYYMAPGRVGGTAIEEKVGLIRACRWVAASGEVGECW